MLALLLVKPVSVYVFLLKNQFRFVFRSLLERACTKRQSYLCYYIILFSSPLEKYRHALYIQVFTGHMTYCICRIHFQLFCCCISDKYFHRDQISDHGRECEGVERWWIPWCSRWLWWNLSIWDRQFTIWTQPELRDVTWTIYPRHSHIPQVSVFLADHC